uniref:Uncharacterized protein n=2 Tax=Physcomitrium patens TaxID=3218 RepID=A0A2K1J285_PHYPA|nr:uncharacterized protein LOC112294316 [Physcomitrium patens]PNR35642.1 hypothetical protein PHYPA_021492 [Physcomitrium patens]|eukprot:XP_024400381.1 uncharacterized protein LOC112294316 [Physcomitrella patens]
MPMAEVNELAVKMDSEGGGRDERSRAPWILSDKVAIAQCRLPKWASPSGTMSSKTRDAIVPGGEKWAGAGLQYGILSFPNARDLITPGEFGREFQNLRRHDMMDIIWEHVTDLSANKPPLVPTQNAKFTKLVVWAPGSMFADPDTNTYFVYHPLVLETRNRKPNGSKSWLLVGYNDEHGTGDENRDWTSLPSIDFLPEHESLNNRRIIAGSAGLLVISAGQQGLNRKLSVEGVKQTPNERFWKHPEIYRSGQSIVFVANPLTREYIILPPIPGRLMHNKIGRFIWRNKERTSYVLVLVGWDVEIDAGPQLHQSRNKSTKCALQTNMGETRETIALFVYCSEERCYIYGDEIRGRPSSLCSMGNSGVATIGHGVFVGGMNTPRHTTSTNPLTPCVYYFNISDHAKMKKLIIPFFISDPPRSMPLEAPKVVQAGPLRIFATTRATVAAITVYVVEMVLDEHEQAFQKFKVVATMPRKFYHRLMSKSPCNQEYSVSSCHGVISFMASRTPVCVVRFHVDRLAWSSSCFPRQMPSSDAFSCQYHLVDAASEPSFHAKP